MSNYTTLIASKTTPGSIANWLNHSSLENAAPTIVEEAESMIYRRLRHFLMVDQTTGTIATNDTKITFPSDYLEDRVLFITGTQQAFIVRKTIEEVIANYCYDGNGNRVPSKPKFYCNDKASIVFDAPADQNYPYLLWYYQQPAPLSTSITNFLTTRYPRLLRCACCIGAAEFMKDSGVGNYDRTYWEQQFELELFKAQAESDRSQRSITGAARVE